jgi:hypothetical protein
MRGVMSNTVSWAIEPLASARFLIKVIGGVVSLRQDVLPAEWVTLYLE